MITTEKTGIGRAVMMKVTARRMEMVVLEKRRKARCAV
jgi:hypothetical protein